MHEPSSFTPRTNLYTLLGIETFAPPEVVQKAYRQRVKTHHPDVAGEATLERFKHITQAYAILNDATARQGYDEELKATLLAVQTHVEEFKKRRNLKEEVAPAFLDARETSATQTAPITRVETRDEAPHPFLDTWPEPMATDTVLGNPTHEHPSEEGEPTGLMPLLEAPLRGVLISTTPPKGFFKKTQGTLQISPAQALLGCRVSHLLPEGKTQGVIELPPGLCEGATVEVQQGKKRYTYTIQIQWPALPLSPALQQAYQQVLIAEGQAP
jgi:hypothetical protein